LHVSNVKDYYIDRQDNYSSLLSGQLNSNTSLESKAVDKYLNYNFSIEPTKNNIGVFNSSVDFNSSNDDYVDHANSLRINKVVPNFHTLDLAETSANLINLNSISDAKYYNNPFKLLLNNHSKKKQALYLNSDYVSDLYDVSPSNEASELFSNKENSYRFKDSKSSNLGFLAPDKNSRLISKLHTDKGQFNLSATGTNLADMLSNFNNNKSSSNESSIYTLSSQG
jgi:hypothetical protein